MRLILPVLLMPAALLLGGCVQVVAPDPYYYGTPGSAAAAGAAAGALMGAAVDAANAQAQAPYYDPTPPVPPYAPRY